uniref:Veg20 n=1 Tax=uncultured soil bacterium TaxID=164851 RepID=B7T192_9BACT|nr:VEG20 [uncultured soil bacterium]
MGSEMRLLAISPHLDDAVLSIGAWLAQAAQDGAKVTVYTAFAGLASPPYSAAAERMHGIWGLSRDEDATVYRRKEDIAALDHLGVAYRHGRFLDSIYRKLPDGRWLADHLDGAKMQINEDAPDSDPDLVASISDEIKSVIDELSPTLLVTCAAILDHPDNQATRDAALFAARSQGIPIRLWEDLPYAIIRPAEVELPSGFSLGAADFSPATAEMRTRKFQAIECYPSQLAMFRGRNNNNTFERLDSHARKTSADGGYGETTWPVLVS